MFEIGPTELLLVCVIGLLVLGPKRLPKVAAEIGKWVGRARRTASQLRRQLEREIEISELEKLEPKTPPPTTPPPPEAASSTAPTPPEAASQPAPESALSAPPRGNGAGDPHALPVDDDGHRIGGGTALAPPPAGPTDDSGKPDKPDAS